MAITWPGGTAIYAVGVSGATLVSSNEVGGVTGVPAWSADGTEVAFNMHVGQTTSSYYGEIQIFDPTSGNSIASFIGTDPSWNPGYGSEDLLADVHPDGTVTSPGIEWVNNDGGLAMGTTIATYTDQPTNPVFTEDSQEAMFIIGGNLVADSALFGGSSTPSDAGASGVTSFVLGPDGDQVLYLAPDGQTCDLDSIAFDLGSDLFTQPSTTLVTGVSCAAAFAFDGYDESAVALASGTKIYLLPFPATGSSDITSLTPALTATATVSQVAFTYDELYLAYSFLTPNSNSPGQGTLTLTLVPYELGYPLSTSNLRTLTKVGQTFALSPQILSGP